MLHDKQPLSSTSLTSYYVIAQETVVDSANVVVREMLADPFGVLPPSYGAALHDCTDNNILTCMNDS